jgi:hypothetical protein
MATGTGKTYTAFQIIWRLWKAGRKKRILFLADRNVLIDQTMVNDFRPFGPAMAKLSTASKTIERADGSEVELTLALDKKRRIDTAYEIYLGLYQAITGPEERQKLFREFSPEFFDLIVIDECHRGSAAEDSAWREILEYFGKATQIGLTATPKETEYVSNSHYFGEAVYTYSLKQGISDGARRYRCEQRGEFVGQAPVRRICGAARDPVEGRPQEAVLGPLGIEQVVLDLEPMASTRRLAQLAGHQQPPAQKALGERENLPFLGTERSVSPGALA